LANEIIGEKREGQAAIRSAGGMPVLDETYHFLVKADNKNNSRINILSTPGLPIVGVTMSAFGISVCKGKTAVRRDDQSLYWDVTCEFSSEVEERQSNQNPGSNPETWVPIYETKFERLQEVVTKDKDGTAIANSAGQPFESGLTISRFIPVWEFFQIEPATVSDETIIDRNETVNSTSFKGRAAKTLLLTVNSSVIGFYYGQRRRLTQYSIKYNSRKWTNKRLDLGTVFLNSGVHKPYEDSEGNVILGGLNGSGAKVTVGSPPAVLEFDMFSEISFSSFLRI
jgi:hypothetical protein